ncbi:MAG TPA: Gfo/Idh/MocA family oxidoreductase [Anaerolineae bacterium]|nr:Gfo/Idh/MocA family oxidoreductase [Anaerolineae bacterium]
MKPIRVGVIGVGTMGERHCRVYSNMRGVELAGVFDANATRGHEVAEKYGVRYYDSAAELLREVDAVTIATPTPHHFDLAMEAFLSGVHTLIEKPLAYTLEQGRKLSDTAQRSGLIVQVGHIERFNPAFTELKNVADDLPMVAIMIRRQNSFDASNKDVDVINDLMIHDIDLLLNLVGQPVEQVTAIGRTIINAAIDHCVANFSFKDGPVATLIASRITQTKVRTIDITGLNAYVQGDLLGKNVAISRRVMSQYQGAKYRQETVVENIHVPMAEPLLLELQHFVNCVRDHRPPTVTIDDGLKAMQYAAQIVELVRQTSQPTYPVIPSGSAIAETRASEATKG